MKNCIQILYYYSACASFIENKGHSFFLVWFFSLSSFSKSFRRSFRIWVTYCIFFVVHDSASISSSFIPNRHWHVCIHFIIVSLFGLWSVSSFLLLSRLFTPCFVVAVVSEFLLTANVSWRLFIFDALILNAWQLYSL